LTTAKAKAGQHAINRVMTSTLIERTTEVIKVTVRRWDGFIFYLFKISSLAAEGIGKGYTLKSVVFLTGQNELGSSVLSRVL